MNWKAKREQLEQLRQQGKTVVEIAELLGTSYNAVKNALYMLNIVRQHKLTDQQIYVMRNFWPGTIRAIATETGRSRLWVRQLFYRLSRRSPNSTGFTDSEIEEFRSGKDSLSENERAAIAWQLERRERKDMRRKYAKEHIDRILSGEETEIEKVAAEVRTTIKAVKQLRNRLWRASSK